MSSMIFGANGQDGSYLLELLLEKTEEQVVCVVRRSSTDTSGRIKHLLNNPRIVLVEGDVTDAVSVNALLTKWKPMFCFGLAAMSHVATSFEQPVRTIEINAIGVLNILEAIRHCSPRTKFLQASTSELFGSEYDWSEDQRTKYQNENTRMEPNSPYAVAKLAAHHLCRIYREAYNVSAYTAISYNHESPRRGANFVTRKITKWFAELYNTINQYLLECDDTCGGRLLIQEDKDRLVVSFAPEGCTDYEPTYVPKLKLGNLKSQRDWSHAKDIVEGMWLAINYKKPMDFVFCSGQARSIQELVTKVKGLFIQRLRDICEQDQTKLVNKIRSFHMIDENFIRPKEVPYLQGDCSKAKKLLKWQPKISFDELIQEMFEADLKD